MTRSAAVLSMTSFTFALCICLLQYVVFAIPSYHSLAVYATICVFSPCFNEKHLVVTTVAATLLAYRLGPGRPASILIDMEKHAQDKGSHAQQRYLMSPYHLHKLLR